MHDAAAGGGEGTDGAFRPLRPFYSHQGDARLEPTALVERVQLDLHMYRLPHTHIQIPMDIYL